jgi:hypothetical protein
MTAFQSNAFQNNAFQIVTTGTGGRLTITDAPRWNLALADVERNVTVVSDS